MNILLINHYAGSKTHGMEYRPYYLGREWVRQGHQVTILAASFSHVRNVAPAVNDRITEEWIDGIRYLWCPTPGYRGNGIRRVVNILSFVRQLQRRRKWLARYCRPELVIASSTYPLDTWPAHHIARLSSAKLVYEVHDLWPLTPMELGGMSPRHPFIKLMQWAEDYGYRNADRVVSMLPQAKTYMSAHGMAPHKFVHVPNGIAPEEWSQQDQPLPEAHRSAIARWSNEGRFLLGYAGGLALSNALQSLLEAARLLHDSSVGIVLVGHGAEQEDLKRWVEQMRLRNVLFLPPVPKAAIPALLAAMDACYIGWKRSPLYRFGVSPNKLLDYMMAAKPVIHAIEGANDLVADSGCGLSIPPEDPPAIARAVLEMASWSRTQRQSRGHRGRDYVLTHHPYPLLARRFLEIL